MENYEALLATLALMLGSSWASGINLYAVIAILGLGGSTGYVQLPNELVVLQDPLVIGSASIMTVVHFFVDKIPGADTVWDTIHTFIRIPAGAMLAAGSIGDATPALEIAAGLLGGSVAATTHATKAGTRLMINTSPEPASNWSASLTEDFLVLSGMWAALKHPEVFLVLFVIFIIFAIWVLPKLWRFIKILLNKLRRFFGAKNLSESLPADSGDTLLQSHEPRQLPASDKLKQ
ncbi:MAG TPA: DUF4126 domain-containing protein [Nitrosomonas sp.]|nr:DUF4126 domain-containing protein [Nitrosomonas sp.]HQX13384.1 DUF4126 domain-containing protein [Nitrosomonas sp.]HRB20136.1 DUF4126 domain-containing protein [Nitrosomonas sp.]HRB31704.1 DUF4126 domain-containing protein [Nitrosomonas sp.]HRB44456.1 DUF4126 domain-containing protein [Nitrosomonas sp.]